MAPRAKKYNTAKGKETRKTILNDEPKQLGQGKRDKLIDTVEYQQKVEHVYESIRQGMSFNEIYATALSEDMKLTRGNFEILFKHALKYAEHSLQKDRDYVFKLHMERYEDMFYKSMKMEDSWGRPLDHKQNNQHWPVMVAKLSNALKILRSKEDLLGLHDRKVVLEFNDQKAVVVENKDDRGIREVPGYKLDNLSLEEKVELLRIIQQSRTVPIEGIQRVVIKQLKIEINPDTGERTERIETKNIDHIQDIEFEEMPDNVLSKVKTVVREEKEPEKIGPIFVDEAPEDKGKNVTQVADGVKNKILEQFRERLKNKREIK